MDKRPFHFQIKMGFIPSLILLSLRKVFFRLVSLKSFKIDKVLFKPFVKMQWKNNIKFSAGFTFTANHSVVASQRDATCKARLNDMMCGFSRIEMMIAIFIIIAIAAAFFASFDVSKKNSRNIIRISQIKEYQKNFEAYRSDYGTYPLFPIGNEIPTNGSFVCLFDHPDDRCYLQNQEGGSSLEVKEFVDQLVPKYFNSLPIDPGTVFEGSQYEYEGAVYRHEQSGRAYRIQYLLEGSDRDCGLPHTESSNFGKSTKCVLIAN